MPKKLKIMQITHDLAIGGLQQVVLNLCKAINKDRFDVSVLCLRDLGEFVPEVEKLGIPVHYIQQPEKGTDYFSFLKVAQILRDEKIDIIHTHNTQPLLDGTIGALLSSVKTIIHTDHARAFPDKKRYMIAERIVSILVDKMVGVSDDTVNNLHKYEGIPRKKLTVIHNGIDIDRYNIQIDSEKKRTEFGITNKGPIIGMVGRLSAEKGIKYLIRAMPDVIKTIPNVNLLIVGDGDEIKDLVNEASKLEISNNVKFLGSRMDIPEILNLMDIFVLPSLREGLPMVLLEAMAAGCAIIASNVGGVPTIIEKNKNGILVPAANPNMLSEVIINLISDEAKRHSFIKISKSVANKFSIDQMFREYEKLYLQKMN